MTTTWARLKLYEHILYTDADSVIHRREPGQPIPERGTYLGQYKSEIKVPRGHTTNYITEFVSAGAKTYAYKTLVGEQECPVRGFTLNTRNS